MSDVNPFGLVELLGAFVAWILSCIWVLYPLIGSSETSETHAYFMYVTGERSSLDRYDEKYRGRFATIDLFALFVILQFPLIIVAYSGSLTGIVSLIIFVAVPAIWWLGLASLAKHQVIDWRRRFTLLTFVLPSLCFVGFPAVLVVGTLIQKAYPFMSFDNRLAMFGAAIAVSLFLWFLFIVRITTSWCISPYSRWSPWG